MGFFAVIFSGAGLTPPLSWMVLYIGPEVFMPVLSAIAGAVGVLLMFWQRVTGVVAKVWRTLFNREG